MQKLIMVSNRLPVGIGSDGTATRTTGGLAAALDGVDMGGEQVWVGWPGGCITDYEDPAEVRRKLEKTGIVPVFLTEEEVDGFYEGYANATLWPVLHNMVERAKFSRQWPEIYRAVNLKFAEAVRDVAEDGDLVWIHDYHLFLVPELLRTWNLNLRVGFFLHTPFCGSDSFRVLPERGELLEGLLGADLIGFHTYDYQRHFRSSLLRILGRDSEIEKMWHHGREVRIGVYPIGHNHAGFEQAMKAPDFHAVLEGHRRDLAGKRLILNVERLDYTKGLPEKLTAMRRFLELNPEQRDEILFVLVAVPSRQGVPEYDDLTEEVQREVGAINGEFGRVGHSPVQFLHRSFPPADLAALYALAEICLVTPLRDGMNLVAKEFLDCQRPEFPARPGVLILSEFAGAAQELSHAIHVNPYDTDGVAEAISRALAMPDVERIARIVAMQGRLRKHHSGVWAKRFLKDLDQQPDREEAAVITDLQPLALDLARQHREGRKLGLFLDYDGTLRDFVAVPEQALPDSELPALLRELAATPGVAVALVSGRAPAFLEQHFGGLGVTLVGEHGYCWLEDGAGEWTVFNPHVTTEWKNAIRANLEQASLLTPGTYVEEKQSALVWHYRKADPEFGPWRARGVLAELRAMAANLPVIVQHGQKIVEVSSIEISKGTVVEHLFKVWSCDAALVAGDDQTDETMLALKPESIDFFAIKVGKGSTGAAYRTDIAGLRKFLNRLRDLLRAPAE